MSLKDEILADVAFMNTELGEPVFTWNGTDYACVPGTSNEERDLDVGGFNTMADLVVSVKTDLFTDGVYPKSQRDKITYLGVIYRVMRVGVMAHGGTIRLHCVNEFRFK